MDETSQLSSKPSYTELEEQNSQLVKQINELKDRLNHVELVEDALAKNQYYLSKAQEIGKIGTWELDIINNRLYWTKQNYINFGLKQGTKLTYETFVNCIHPDDRDSVNSEWSAAMQGKPYDIEHRIISDGKIRWLREKADVKFDENGKAISAIGFTQDITHYKESKQELQKSEKRYRSLVENIPAGIFRSVSKGKIISANSAMAQIYGYDSVEELLNTDASDFYSDINPRQMMLRDLKKKGFLLDYITEEQRKDGSKIWVSSNYRLIESNEFKDEEFYIDGVSFDITKQHKVEQKLKQSDRVFNLSLDMFCIAGFDGYFKYLNPAWEKILGWSIEELLSKPWLEFVHPDDIEKTENVKSVIVEEKEIYQFENRYICKDGSTKWLSWNSQPFPDENIMIGAVRDITRQKETEQTLIESKVKLNSYNEQLQLSIKTAELGLWNLDLKTGKLDWNDILLKIYGISREEFENDLDGWRSQVHPEDKDYADSRLAETLKGKTVYNVEFRIIRTDGAVRYIDASASPYYNSDGEIDRLLGINIDITDRKKSEIDLIKAKEKAEESDRLKSAFLANMSHEIRTPMNGILGFTNLLQEHDLTGEQQQQYIEIIQKSGDRMLNTVNDIIEISKIDTGQVKVSNTDVNVTKHLKTLHDFFSLEAEKKGLKLIFNNELSEDESLILSDKNKLSSILSNLIKNAIKYTEKGIIKIGCKKNKEFLELYVEDSGIGIPANRKEAIFNRFEQADIEDKQVHEGSGLGLAIVKSYVEMLDGEIWVESEEYKGATFFFTLPFIPAKAETKTKNADKIQEDEEVKKLNILIVEDDETSSYYLSTILKHKADNIQIATNGLEAVEVCKNNSNFDIVLMDIKMPGIDGLEATEKIRKFNKDVKIIAQTAHALEGDNEKAIKAGCNSYISKPIVKEKFIALIDKILLQ